MERLVEQSHLKASSAIISRGVLVWTSTSWFLSTIVHSRPPPIPQSFSAAPPHASSSRRDSAFDVQPSFKPLWETSWSLFLLLALAGCRDSSEDHYRDERLCQEPLLLCFNSSSLISKVFQRTESSIKSWSNDGLPMTLMKTGERPLEK